MDKPFPPGTLLVVVCYIKQITCFLLLFCLLRFVVYAVMPVYAGLVLNITKHRECGHHRCRRRLLRFSCVFFSLNFSSNLPDRFLLLLPSFFHVCFAFTFFASPLLGFLFVACQTVHTHTLPNGHAHTHTNHTINATLQDDAFYKRTHTLAAPFPTHTLPSNNRLSNAVVRKKRGCVMDFLLVTKKLTHCCLHARVRTQTHSHTQTYTPCVENPYHRITDFRPHSARKWG